MTAYMHEQMQRQIAKMNEKLSEIQAERIAEANRNRCCLGLYHIGMTEVIDVKPICVESVAMNVDTAPSWSDFGKVKMSDCECCSNMGYHGIRRDGWPPTVYGYCEHFGHNRPPDNCHLFNEGVPRYFDKRGIEITPEQLEKIPNPMGGER